MNGVKPTLVMHSNTHTYTHRDRQTDLAVFGNHLSHRRKYSWRVIQTTCMLLRHSTLSTQTHVHFMWLAPDTPTCSVLSLQHPYWLTDGLVLSKVERTIASCSNRLDITPPAAITHSNIWPHCDLDIDLSTFKIYSLHLYPQLHHQPKFGEILSNGL